MIKRINLYQVTTPLGSVLVASPSLEAGNTVVQVQQLCVNCLGDVLVAARSLAAAGVEYSAAVRDAGDRTEGSPEVDAAWRRMAEAIGQLSLRVGKLHAHAAAGVPPAPLSLVDTASHAMAAQAPPH